MTIVKICGLTTFEDALAAAEAGADMLGFNFYKKSPRYISPEAAQPICDGLRSQLGESCPVLIGLFVNEVVGLISAITRKVGLDGAQLSGDKSDDMLAELRGIGFKSIHPMNMIQAMEDVSLFPPTVSDQRTPAFPTAGCLSSTFVRWNRRTGQCANRPGRQGGSSSPDVSRGIDTGECGRAGAGCSTLGCGCRQWGRTRGAARN